MANYAVGCRIGPDRGVYQCALEIERQALAAKPGAVTARWNQVTWPGCPRIIQLSPVRTWDNPNELYRELQTRAFNERNKDTDAYDGAKVVQLVQGGMLVSLIFGQSQGDQIYYLVGHPRESTAVDGLTLGPFRGRVTDRHTYTSTAGVQRTVFKLQWAPEVQVPMPTLDDFKPITAEALAEYLLANKISDLIRPAVTGNEGRWVWSTPTTRITFRP